MDPGADSQSPIRRRRRRIPRSFKDLTPTNAFRPAKFFHELVWKALRTRRIGRHQEPNFPKLQEGQVAITWIGHASFLLQFTDQNVLIDPNFANWLFLLKRLRRTGLKLRHLPPIDLVLLTHAHFDHFHKPTLRRLPSPKMAVMPWGVGELARDLGFQRTIELEWWDTFVHNREWKVTFTPSAHWGARTIHDENRGFGGFVFEHQGRTIYHAGDSAYFEGFKNIGERLRPEIALLPIGAYHPVEFRNVHMNPEEAIKVFNDLRAKWLVPMHYGSFRLSFEAMDEPPRLLQKLAHEQGVADKLRFLDEGIPVVF